jgi:hypothetical protein
MSFYKVVTAEYKIVAKPTKDEIVRWVYGNCWSFAVALVDEFGYVPKVILDEQGHPDHAFAESGRFAIDASGVLTKQKLKARFPHCKIESLHQGDDPYFLFTEMAQDYSEPGYTVDDARQFIKKHQDYYDATKNNHSYQLTQQDVDKAMKRKVER